MFIFHILYNEIPEKKFQTENISENINVIVWYGNTNLW